MLTALLALHLYICGCLYFYWVEMETENANSFLRIGEVLSWPVVLPFYMAVLWIRHRKG